MGGTEIFVQDNAQTWLVIEDDVAIFEERSPAAINNLANPGSVVEMIFEPGEIGAGGGDVGAGDDP